MYGIMLNMIYLQSNDVLVIFFEQNDAIDYR